MGHFFSPLLPLPPPSPLFLSCAGQAARGMSWENFSFAPSKSVGHDTDTRDAPRLGISTQVPISLCLCSPRVGATALGWCNVTGSSRIWTGPFGPIAPVCRAGRREEGLIRILANGYTLDLFHRNWTPPQCAFVCLYLFPFLCSSLRYVAALGKKLRLF